MFVRRAPRALNLSLIALMVSISSSTVFAQSAVPVPGMSAPSSPPTPTPVPMSGPVSVPMTLPALVVPDSPQEALRAGLRAADRGAWSDVRDFMSRSRDARVRNMMLWRLTTSDSNPARFDELVRALDELPGFPARRAIRIRAEETIQSSGLSPQARVDFLMRKEKNVDDAGPISGEGKLELGWALLTLGRNQEAARWISDGWRNHRLDVSTQASYLTRLGSILTPQDHDGRVDFLLWADRRTQARSLLPFMTAEERVHAQRRMGLAAGDGATLSGAVLDDRGVKYEAVRALRNADRRTEALQLLTQIDSRGLPEPGQDLLWTERRNLLNEAIITNDWRSAYRVASTHGYERGERFADGEFVAGWVSLRFLNDPATAMRHFTKLEAGVRAPVSKARALYWLGRTADAQGRTADAERFYTSAAAFPTVYYGQLAAVALGTKRNQAPRLTLPPEKRATQDDRNKLNTRPQMAVINLLADIGDNQFFRQFALALDDELSTEGDHQALSEYARAKGEPLVGIRVAKSGLNRGVLATEAAFPLMSIPRIVGYGQAEDAFSLAITRQESEFNTKAISGANARGLMQFVPATAASQARKMGIPHDTSWLISRPEHNLTLGSAHLHDLVSNFNGSYVMAITAYNAGPGRPRQWVQTYGDLRETNLETAIDWVEKIPFAETRNYVQRVLENMQVYRARLAGGSAPLEIGADLMRGRRPAPVFNVTIAPGANQPGGPPPAVSTPPVTTPPAAPRPGVPAIYIPQPARAPNPTPAQPINPNTPIG